MQVSSKRNGLDGQWQAARDLLAELIGTIPQPTVIGINPEQPAGAIVRQIRQHLGHRRASIVSTKLLRQIAQENAQRRLVRRASNGRYLEAAD
jgi:hypothetical protein